nr:immunoglobulin light chain junction region [Macaca mulatta]
CHNHSDSPYSF